MFKIRLCLFCVGLFITICVYSQTNRALIVTISQYPNYSGWEPLHAYNDKKILQSYLIQNRFSMQNILFLSESAATKQCIVDALQKLYTQTTAGDYLYIHFSCHGQQMMDDNGDEEDGLDEALIPYDATFWYIPGRYEGQNHLRDDELGLWIDKLRRKAGSNGYMTVVLDACHSGTGNRKNEQQEYVRGTGAIFAPDDYVPQKGKNLELSLHLKPKTGCSPATVFSACMSEENNYEYFHRESSTYYGFLTYAFLNVASKTQASGVSVSGFMQQLVQEMKQLKPRSSKQTPYMECTHKNISFKIGK